MFRLAYRNFGGYASLVLNHSVKADNGRIGIRWYEVRIPKGGTPSIYQQGTYAPDGRRTRLALDGLIADDRTGDIALGYSASGPNDYPSVRYTGRAADALGQMTQTEQVATRAPARRRRSRPLGRLQRHDRRPGRRLHLLVHPGVPGHRHGRAGPGAPAPSRSSSRLQKAAGPRTAVRRSVL